MRNHISAERPNCTLALELVNNKLVSRLLSKDVKIEERPYCIRPNRMTHVNLQRTHDKIMFKILQIRKRIERN